MSSVEQSVQSTQCQLPQKSVASDLNDLKEVVNGRVVVAMSGGVDSSVTAAILAGEGYDAVGISMRLYSTPQESFTKSCCSPDDLFDARAVADSLSIPFYVANYEEAFRERVINYFVDEYRRGRTPNPCVACNNHLKFDILLGRSLALGARYLATGHFARIDRSGEQPVLRRGTDRSKDQSYFLFGLPREALSRILFPLGELTKEQVRGHARRLGMETAEKPESMEICFVGGGDYKDFVAKLLEQQERTPGQIVTERGEVLGDHDGIHQFTVGQRRGLGIGHHEPLYVRSINATTGAVVVGGKDALHARGLIAERCNWLSFERPSGPMECSVKIRYAGEPVPALITLGEDAQTVFVEFESPQRAVTPGQAAVFYRDDEVLGGGWIEEARS
ncbi:MAG: tRNA 2-thiouridine(34) synthase MnmA [Bradymonadaceae bacterium]|nr:tRNA 2-thiouridine(34) synthase MnmA [Lujinxingiaceae bacterium]